MAEEVKDFIDKLADGDNDGAGEAFKDALRAKVGANLDAHRQALASNMFSGEVEAHSDPKPEIANPGTFNKDGSVTPTTDGKAQIDLTTDQQDNADK